MNVKIQTVICGMIQENAYIVQAEGRDDCVVVDPGEGFSNLKSALGERRVGAILLTHGHFDHIMSAGDMAAEYGAPVYAAAGDFEIMNDAVLNGYELLMGTSHIDWAPIAAQPYGDRLSACGMDFTVLPTPGHSKGSVGLYLEEAGILFSGDTLFRAGYGRLDLHGGNLKAMINSLKLLFTLPPDVRVYPGHGEGTTIGEEKRRYRL